MKYKSKYDEKLKKKILDRLEELCPIQYKEALKILSKELKIKSRRIGYLYSKIIFLHFRAYPSVSNVNYYKVIYSKSEDIEKAREIYLKYFDDLPEEIQGKAMRNKKTHFWIKRILRTKVLYYWKHLKLDFNAIVLRIDQDKEFKKIKIGFKTKKNIIREIITECE